MFSWLNAVNAQHSQSGESVSEGVVASVVGPPLLFENDFLHLHELRFHGTYHRGVGLNVWSPYDGLGPAAKKQNTMALNHIVGFQAFSLVNKDKVVRTDLVLLAR